MAIFNITNNKGVIPSPTLTSFLVGENSGDACLLFNGSPFNVTLYHNGNNDYPQIDDAIFVDEQGLIPYFPLNDLQMANGQYLRILEGIRVNINCS